MTPLPIHSIWVDPYTRAALKEYAWNRRTTMGDVVRAVLLDVIQNADDESLLGPDGVTANKRLSVKVKDKTWEKARDAAHAAGFSINSLVRRRLRKMLIDEGLL